MNLTLRSVVPVLSAIIAGCASHSHQPFDDGPASGLYTRPAVSSDFYSYSAPVPQPALVPTRRSAPPGYSGHWLRFASSEINGQRDNMVEARYFQSSVDPARSKPLLIVLPIWATHTFPSTIVAGSYARHTGGEAHILWLQGDEPLFDWFHLAGLDNEAEFVATAELSAERFRGVAVDIRRLLDWAETRPEIDGGRIAIVGFSMSALVAANVAGNDPRIHTAVYMVGGAYPWDMMAECGVVVAYMRENVKESLGWSQQEFRNFFRLRLAMGDPARWRGRYRPENTLIIEAEADDCVPPASREAFWHATGRPERILFPYNHWQPFLALTPVGGNVLIHDIFDFLDRKLFIEYQQQQAPLRRQVSR
jgi:hypothetical protein